MGEMRDSDWSRRNLLRSDWLPTKVAMYTTNNNNLYTYTFNEKEEFLRKFNTNNMFIKEKRVKSSYNLFLCICIYSH